MANVDWQKVAEDYARSTLDMARLAAYAQGVAQRLVTSGAKFTAYTDSDTKSFWEASRDEGFLKTLFKDKTGFDYQHLGYWVLENTYSSQSHKDRKKTRFDGYGSQPSFSVQMSRAAQFSEKWVLLEDGRLAKFGSSSSGTEHRTTNNSRFWRVMTSEDILLLDHRTRTREHTYNNRGGTGYEFSNTLSSDNHLVTGKKGGGCSKKLTTLLKDFGIEDQPSRPEVSRPQPAARDRPPVTRTYTVTSEQLRDGCVIQHTFKNGTTISVSINANTRSGKIVTVRTRQSEGAESIRVIAN